MSNDRLIKPVARKQKPVGKYSETGGSMTKTRRRDDRKPVAGE
jgi:hypothetical protein